MYEFSNVIRGKNVQMNALPGEVLEGLSPRESALLKLVAPGLTIGEETGTPVRARIIKGGAALSSARPVELALLEAAPEFPLYDAGKTDKPGPEPEPTIDIDALKAEWDARWQIRLDAEVAAANQKSFEDGFQAAIAQLSDEFEQHKSMLTDDVQRLNQAWSDFLDRSEPLMAELAFSVAQSVLEVPLPPGVKGVAGRAIIEAVENLRGNAPIEIALHPVDFLRLQETGVVDQLESLNSEVRWEPNADLRQGEWIVQTPVATIRRIEEELLTTLRSRIGLLTALQSGKRAFGGNTD